MKPRVLQVMAALGASVAALTLTIATVRVVRLGAMVQSNLVQATPRRQIIGLTLGAFAVTVLLAAWYLRRERERGLDVLAWLARLVCPVILLPLFAALTQRGVGTDLEEGVLLAAFVLGFERLLRVSFEAWAERPKTPTPAWVARLRNAVQAYFANPRAGLVTIIGLAVAHSAFMALWALWQHGRFNTYGYDTGQYDQLFYSTLHGHWLAAPTQGSPQDWGDLVNSHADFVIFALLPIYALHPAASTLLVLQATLVGTAAVPLYLFAREWLPAPWALAMGVAWLLYAPMQTALFYGLHTQMFGAAFVMWAIYAVEHQRWRLYWVFFVLAISCREDVPMGMAALGLLLAVSGHRFKTGLATAAISVAYFFSMRFLVMPSTGFANMYSVLTAAGENGFGAIIQTLISNPVFALRSLVTPEKVRFLLQVMAPLAFLPLRRPALWVVMVPAALLTLFTTEYAPTISIGFQYLFNWPPYAFSAAVVALSLLGEEPGGALRQRAVAVAVLAACVASTLLWGAYNPQGTLFSGFAEVPLARPSDADRQRAVDLATVLAKVPVDARLCTSDRIQTHTTQHLQNWSLRDGLFDCEYLLYSDLPGDLGSERGIGAVRGNQYQVAERLGGLTLAKKTPPPPPPAPVVPPAPPAGGPAERGERD